MKRSCRGHCASIAKRRAVLANREAASALKITPPWLSGNPTV